jgi:hypothetical protein
VNIHLQAGKDLVSRGLRDGLTNTTEYKVPLVQNIIDLVFLAVAASSLKNNNLLIKYETKLLFKDDLVINQRMAKHKCF